MKNAFRDHLKNPISRQNLGPLAAKGVKLLVCYIRKIPENQGTFRRIPKICSHLY